jgi:Autophagy-related protein 27
LFRCCSQLDSFSAHLRLLFYICPCSTDFYQELHFRSFLEGVLRLDWRTKHACPTTVDNDTPSKDKDKDKDNDPSKPTTKHWGFLTWLIIMYPPVPRPEYSVSYLQPPIGCDPPYVATPLPPTHPHVSRVIWERLWSVKGGLIVVFS